MIRVAAIHLLVAFLASGFVIAQEGDVYHLRPNDMIKITVYQEDDLTTETRISKSGDITFPLLGTLRLAGKTPKEAIETIRSALDKDYIINPQVTLTVIEYAKQRITVLGQVQKPGAIEIPDDGKLTLLDAIAMAGGYTRIAAPNRVTLRRRVGEKDRIFKIDAKKLAADPEAKPFYVYADDTITVGESYF
jgi:protein involved in polysaccharide export with SLBB domain